MAIMREVTPVTHNLGDFQVRRAIPARELAMVGPFIFIDQFGPSQIAVGKGMDVRPHPHINLATVTWLFEGAIEHRDSLGNFATIRPGQVNLMTAGRGISHTEDSVGAKRTVHGAQLWIALPEEHQDAERHQHRQQIRDGIHAPGREQQDRHAHRRMEQRRAGKAPSQRLQGENDLLDEVGVGEDQCRRLGDRLGKHAVHNHTDEQHDSKMGMTIAAAQACPARAKHCREHERVHRQHQQRI